jgi:hypothetical protein
MSRNNSKAGNNAEEKASINMEGTLCINVEGIVCTTVEERRFGAASSAKDVTGFSPRGRTFYATIFAIFLIALSAAQAQKPATASVTADLPPGAMQAKATTACLECHEARIILQQRLTKAAWSKEVDKMTKWGALVDPADRDALIDYLSTNFSAEKPPYTPQRTSGSGKTK